MATEVIVTVGPGKDYPTLAAWEAARQRDLVAADEIEIVECYPIEDITAVTIAGWTTDATRRVIIRTPAAYRHGGKWNTNAYRLKTTNATCITVDNANVTLDGLQLETAPTLTNSNKNGISANAYAGIEIKNCLVRRTGTGTGDNYGISISLGALASGQVSVANCVVSGFNGSAASRGITFYCSSTAVGAIYNCTAYQCSNGFYRSNGTVTVKNCLAQGCTTPFSAGFAAASTANCSENGTPAGTNPRIAAATFVDAANGDFHLSDSDTAARGYGYPLHADALYPFSTDIDGQSIVTWSIGADAQAGPLPIAAPDTNRTLYLDEYLVVRAHPIGSASGTVKSAYDLWLEEGHVGTVQNFLDSLRGLTGPQGMPGEAVSFRNAGDEFVYTHVFGNNVDPFTSGSINSGSIQVPNITPPNAYQHPGILRIMSGTNANSGYRFTTQSGYLCLSSDAFVRAVIAPAGLATGLIRFGYIDTTTEADVSDGFYLQIDNLTVIGKTANNGTRSQTGTSYAMTAGTFYVLTARANADFTEITFAVSNMAGDVLWTDTLSTNLPSTSVANWSGLGLTASSSGTTAADLCHVDFIGGGTWAGWQTLQARLLTWPVDAEPRGQGECRLEYVSATGIILKPVGRGGIIHADGTAATVPAAGIARNAVGLVAETLYYVYLTQGSELELSTTAPAYTGGHRHKTGDTTRLLVGMVRTNASAQYQFDAAYRGVASWFNRRKFSAIATLASDRSNATTTFQQLSASTELCNFLTWGTLTAAATGCVSGSIANAGVWVALTFDGARATQLHGAISAVAGGALGGSIPSIPIATTEGWHTVGYGGRTYATGTLVAYGGAVDYAIRTYVETEI